MKSDRYCVLISQCDQDVALSRNYFGCTVCVRLVRLTKAVLVIVSPGE